MHDAGINSQRTYHASRTGRKSVAIVGGACVCVRVCRECLPSMHFRSLHLLVIRTFSPERSSESNAGSSLELSSYSENCVFSYSIKTILGTIVRGIEIHIFRKMQKVINKKCFTKKHTVKSRKHY